MLKASKDDANLAIEIVKNNITEFTPLQLFIITLLITKYYEYRDIMRYWGLFECHKKYWGKWDEFDDNRKLWTTYIYISDNIEMERKFSEIYSKKIMQLEYFLKNNYEINLK